MTDTPHFEDLPRRPAPFPLVHLVLLSGFMAVICGAGAVGGYFLVASQEPIGSWEEAEIPELTAEMTPFDKIRSQLNHIEGTLYEIQDTLGKLEGGPALHLTVVGAQPEGEGSAEQ